MGDSLLFGGKSPDRAHLVRGTGGLSGEINDLRDDMDEAIKALEDNGGLLQVDEFIDPAAADTDGIKTTFSSSASEQVFTADNGDFDGVVGAGDMDPPRNITITTGTNADIDAVDVVIEGEIKDKNGDVVAQSDTISLTDGGASTDAGTLAFLRVTKITIPAQSGPGGTIEIGFGDIIGLSKPIKTRAGLTQPLREVEAGSVVTTGTFADPSTSAPNGTYTPAVVADGANDYALTYEVDPAA